MSDFKREERYTVVKHKDISDAQLQRLRNYLAANGMPTRTCVVVEPDWPIYGLVWQMIESLTNGKVPIDPKVLAADLNAALEREQASANYLQRLRLDYQSLCDKLKSSLEREQALAAHVEQFDSIMDALASDLDGGDDFDSDPIPDELWSLRRTTPATSLAQRDAKLVAEALKNLLGIVRCSGNRHLIATVETNIDHLLKRAEGHQ